ncbi:hypothetical protein X975_08729, partial [Stegodyphus mimosarum]
MLLKLVVALCCVAVTLATDSYYHVQPRGFIHEQPQLLSEHQKHGLEHGNHAAHEYDHEGLRKLQHLQSSHGANSFGAGDAHALRDLALHNHHDKGAHASLQLAGAQEGHINRGHDRGFYEREKKYGYEKGYGYERETKHHDRDHSAKSFGSGYKHNENKGHYNRGAHALRDLAAQGHRYKHGSNAYGHNNALIDISANHNRGKDILSNYGKNFHLRDLNVVRPQPVVVYQPHYIHRSHHRGIDNSLGRFRYLNGLGGIRGYGLGFRYGHSPLRYGYSNGHFDSEVLSPSQSFLGLSNIHYNI